MRDTNKTLHSDDGLKILKREQEKGHTFGKATEGFNADGCVETYLLLELKVVSQTSAEW